MTEISKLTSDKHSNKNVKNILITQARPENEKSPYFELARKHQVNLEFESFISVVPIPSKEFRKQKIDIANYSAVIFTSRNAIENFFRTCEEMRITVSADTKYFCISEAVALYLQKFILYRKRKVFYGDDGTNASLFIEISKFKDQEKFLYPCSEAFDSEITNWLIANQCVYAIPVLYQIISNDIKAIVKKFQYEIICFFSPLGVRSLKENFPDFNQNGTLIGAFGDNTRKAVLAAGLNPDIIAPQPKAPSMIAALDQYLTGLGKSK
ncbi:MAG: uroporphyrinogen-III synthase [Bacteroidetes bacterium]|nr:uroporphyrinogen-III synthase [Bacteroidota bacterium]